MAPMMRRYMAVGALAAVAVLVAAIVVLIMPQTHEPASTASSAASAPPASSASAPARVSAQHGPSASAAGAHGPLDGAGPAAVPAAREVASVPAGSRSLDGGLFTASYPAGWRLTSAQVKGVTRYQLSSTGAPIGALGIGPAGTVGVTIDESQPAGRLGAFAHDAARLLPASVGTPRGALAVTLGARPRTVVLGGAEAAEESYAYTYEGRQNVQSDVLAVRGGRLVLVELDGEPSAARAAQAGFEALMSSWRWR
jgi:hypothetical protein